jgi:CheY-like chemotaxis protein
MAACIVQPTHKANNDAAPIRIDQTEPVEDIGIAIHPGDRLGTPLIVEADAHQSETFDDRAIGRKLLQRRRLDAGPLLKAVQRVRTRSARPARVHGRDRVTGFIVEHPLHQHVLRSGVFYGMARLAGIRVLLVEDEPLVAMGIADQLVEAGAIIVGPFRTIRQAVKAVQAIKIDVAVIDFVLADGQSEPVQDALEDKGVPFVVLTAYPPVMVRRNQSQQILSKPVAGELLCSTVQSLCDRR